MNKLKVTEQGAGLIEVLIALVIIMISALVFSNIQTNASANVRMSDTRFKINEHAYEMLELLRANPSEANAGTYNYDFDDEIVVDSDSTQTLASISRWKSGVAQTFNNGGAKIDCSVVRCLVSIRWEESVDGATSDQYFDLVGLL